MPRQQCARIVATIRVNCYSPRDPRQAQHARILEAGIYGTRTYGRLLSVNDLFGPAVEFIGQCGAHASRTPGARRPIRRASFGSARGRDNGEPHKSRRAANNRERRNKFSRPLSKHGAARKVCLLMSNHACTRKPLGVRRRLISRSASRITVRLT